MVIFLNLVLAGLRLGLKNYQVGETRILDDYLYLCKGLLLLIFVNISIFYNNCYFRVCNKEESNNTVLPTLF
ncbi:hypothetical protein THERMOT_614 [Bathymodiolus thermophilus thioautotrophic gill symbiont]|uniref:Uncharacterized protein n=1 Tax=Bathymodiolus thermophilus thioautotrophic gill symbiont TaxID=2360 RepID=A0A8H9CGR1_9GAMM|nr:hypothetical protein THERMOT_614 [Bathymodiolus thermophilus thioautotrophic gill symbiont]CAB5500025.1 hypothetical protein THERMOS_1135 [Bathymodiolus thermophilus thioautotrophic gill symbiont]